MVCQPPTQSDPAWECLTQSELWGRLSQWGRGPLRSPVTPFLQPGADPLPPPGPPRGGGRPAAAAPPRPPPPEPGHPRVGGGPPPPAPSKDPPPEGNRRQL